MVYIHRLLKGAMMTIMQEQIELHKALVAAGRHAEAEEMHAQLGQLIDVMRSIRQGNRKRTL